jgi:hypothetical protein
MYKVCPTRCPGELSLFAAASKFTASVTTYPSQVRD